MYLEKRTGRGETPWADRHLLVLRFGGYPTYRDRARSTAGQKQQTASEAKHDRPHRARKGTSHDMRNTRGYVILGRPCLAIPSRAVLCCVVSRVLPPCLSDALAICGIAYLGTYLGNGLRRSIGFPPSKNRGRALVRLERLSIG